MKFRRILKTLLTLIIMAGLGNSSGNHLADTVVTDLENPSPLDELFNYNFTIKTLEGKPFDVNSLSGKVIFLNLWATWCGPCRVEMPSIQKVYSEFGSDIAFIMLSIDPDDAINKVKRYVEKNKYTFPVYVPSGELPNDLKVPYIPTTFVIGRDGKILMKEQGARNYNSGRFKAFLQGVASNSKQ